MGNLGEAGAGLDLREFGLKEFSSIGELRQWCEREEAYWKWLDAQMPRDQEVQNAVSQIKKHIRNFYDPIKAAAAPAAGVLDAGRLRDIRSTVGVHTANKKMMFSESPEAKFTDDLSHTNPRLAVYAAALIDVPCNAQSRGVLEGSFLGFTYRHGLRDRTESERLSLEALRAEWSGLLADSRTTFEEITRLYQDLVKEGTEQLGSHAKEFKQFNQTADGEFKALVKKSQEELKSIERTYDEKLALQSAVLYWKRKADGHDRAAKGLSWASGIVGACVALLLSVETVLFIGPLQKVGDLPIWKGAMLLLTAVLGVWAVRILVRLLLSNLHLKSDAVERRTMLLTYLALLRRGQGPTEQQRELILQILFRPSATGIIKDDALPPAVAQWLNLVTSN